MEFFIIFLRWRNLFDAQIDHFYWSKCFWKLAVSRRQLKMIKFWKWFNNFYWWDIIKIIISVGKEKVRFTLIFYLKQNEGVQLDLHFEIFIFFSLSLSLLPEKNERRKLNIQIFAIWNMHDSEWNWFPGNVGVPIKLANSLVVNFGFIGMM